MLNLQTHGNFGMPSQSYAAIKNARFKNRNSIIKTIRQRWDETYNSLPSDEQYAIDIALQAAIAEFRRRNPKFTSWNAVKKEIARSIDTPMATVEIDETMQRLLNIGWTIDLLNLFVATKVVPIQVYQPDPKIEKYLAWDGQHTLVLLWLIATQIFGEDPESIEIPINIYSSNQKVQMRQSFVDLNGPIGKKALDAFDHFEQMVFGYRVDGSTNPLWEVAHLKQEILENHGLFVTSKKFGDETEPGAISRMQEVNKLSPETLGWLCEYLVAVGGQKRPIAEKEMVMMSYFFERCRLAKIKMSKKAIFDIASVVKTHWNADFSPTSKFWAKAGNAYRNWHANHVGVGSPRFNKEPIHGYPFMVAQLKKSLPDTKLPDGFSNSEFVPAAKDLF